MYTPGSCSLIIHCLLEERGVPFEVKRVDFATQEHHGAECRKLNRMTGRPAVARAFQREGIPAFGTT
jgi:glutathione S-transferase